MNLLVTYVSGATGFGKSRYILDNHGDSNVYRVTNYKHPFDTYSGEDVIVFEEFRSDLPIGNMLNYLDISPLQLPARYNNRQACYNFVYIVSNWNLDDQYHNIRLEQMETWNALIRRIHKVGYTRLQVNGRNMTLLIICMDSSQLTGQIHHLTIKSDRRWDFTIYADKATTIKKTITKLILLTNYKIIIHIKFQSNNPTNIILLPAPVARRRI